MTSTASLPPPARAGRGGLVVFTLLAAAMAVLGAALLVAGVRLLAVGGSPFYALAGGLLVASGVLHLLRKPLGFWLFALVSVATYAWSIWESGSNGWAYIPRLAWLIAVSALWLACWPVARRLLPGIRPRMYAAVHGALPLAMLLTILVPIQFPAAVQLADARLVQQRPATPFSRDQVASPDGNVAASHDETNWTAYAGSNLGNHYSAAAQITPANIGQLEKVWEYHHGDLKPAGSKTAYLNEATPLKIGELLYTCTPSQVIVAVEAITGKERWRFDSKVDPVYLKGGGANCRGVAYFEVPNAPPDAACARRVIWGTTDVRLGAVDAVTGQPCAGFGQGGFVDLKGGLGTFRPGSTAITSAPTIVRGTIVTGGQVIDSDVRPAPSGVVRGYDAITGQQRWAWDLGRPGVTTPAAPGETYTLSTPNSWAPLSADDELGLVYVTTGNAAGDFYGGTRTALEGKYSSALVALDAATGQPRWHFQTVHHDVWDYDLSPQPNLVDFPTPQGVRPAVIQATKSAQIFVLDRATGQPLVPVTEVPVPQTDVPGERTAATQPMSLDMPNTMGRPGKTHERLTEASTWGLTPFDHIQCRIDFRQAHYEGQWTPARVDQQTLVYPGHHGGLNWGGVMVDLQRGLLLLNNQRLPYMQSLVSRDKLDALGAKSFQQAPGQSKGFRVQEGQAYGASKGPWMSALNQPCIAPPWGFLSAIDLRTRDVVWSRPFGTGYDSGPWGIPSRTKWEVGTPSDGTGVATAGGVTIIGAALDQFIRGYNSETGELLWEQRLPAGNQASPLTFMANGRQYVVAVVGGHDRIPTKLGDSIIAWALPAR